MREKDLYGPISKELEGNRNTCYTTTVKEYPFSIDEEKGRRIDVASAKWSRESSLEVAAVECKPRPTPRATGIETMMKLTAPSDWDAETGWMRSMQKPPFCARLRA